MAFVFRGILLKLAGSAMAYYRCLHMPRFGYSFFLVVP